MFMAMSACSSLGTACKRYGPGRLPMAERHDIGAGYAMASTALTVSALYAFIAGVMIALGSPIRFDWEFFGIMGLLALPLVIPTAFVSAVLVWRTLPANVPYYGAVGGFLATLGTYILATLVLFTLNAAAVVLYGQFGQLLEAAVFIGFIGLFALATTFWLTFPIGCVSGTIYERVNN